MIRTRLQDIYDKHKCNPPALVSEVGKLLSEESKPLPLAEFAKLAGKSSRTILNYVNSGKLEAENKSGGDLRPRYFIRKSELDKI